VTKPRVTIAGGGLAGMSAALRLAQRGYEVKLYEQKPMLGGNLASRPTPNGVELDVYPHMFLSWYHNFWSLLADSGVDRDANFTTMESVKQLRRNEYPRFTGLTSGYSPRYMVQNLLSGVGPPADMFVFWYSSIDLLAEKLSPTMLLDDVSVTGFMQARPYMTERAMKACDNFITMVWAIPSYQTCAEDYREYLAYSVTNYDPPALLARGPAATQVINPLTAALENAGVQIERQVQLTRVSCTGGRVTEIGLQDATLDPDTFTWVGAGSERTEPVDELLVAVPPQQLSALIRTGDPGERVVDAVPKLAELARLRSQRIPIVHVFFKRKMPPIPDEPVGLYDSNLALAFTDISNIWTGVSALANQTVLSVSASDPYGLPATGVEEEDGFAILRELARYIPFDPGTAWGNSPDIDWAQTRYESNADSQLFINETGIDVWRPAASCPDIDNLWFAGNFCANRIGMMTVESAVASGLEAARAIVERRGLGNPVEIIEPNPGHDLLYLWFRYAFGPSAIAAKAWSCGSDLLSRAKTFLTPIAP
jgi:NAD(P)-binding Rossmann-like domain/Flavin containing amine oxidoreductase